MQAVRRACRRLLAEGPPKIPTIAQRTFGPGMLALVKRTQASLDIPQTGVVGPETFRALRETGSIDRYGDYLLAEYAKQHPVIVEPAQGYRSLHKSLWPIYSTGREMGLSDLGTYNPNSKLPSGAPSDHAVWPAYAFDLGVEPDTGWSNAVGREFFMAATKDRNVEYVILGDRIWLRGIGVRAFHGGGHLNHCHVSGLR